MTTVAAVWLPLAAILTAANRADNAEALTLVAELPAVVRFLLGDPAYIEPALRDCCATADCTPIASKRGAYPHRDGGVEVRRIFHQLRSHVIENFTGQFKAIFDAGGQVPTRGLRATQRYVLSAVLVYQLTLLARSDAGADLRCGLLAYLRAA